MPRAKRGSKPVAEAAEAQAEGTGFSYGANEEVATIAPAVEQVIEEAKQRAEEPPAETSHAARVVKVDKTRAITDPATDMRFQFNHVTHQAEIKFPDKPSPELKGFVMDRGFEYDIDRTTDEKVWHKPIRFEHREQDRVDSKRDFWEAVDMRRAEMGLPPRENRYGSPE